MQDISAVARIGVAKAPSTARLLKNLTAIFANKAPEVPAGYGFDYINADGLIHAIHVDN